MPARWPPRPVAANARWIGPGEWTETYVRVKGKWVYLYRAVEKFGKTLDVMLSRRRNKAAATKSFACALETNGMPRKIVIDKCGANTASMIRKGRFRSEVWPFRQFANFAV
jgi:transposase-like protein